MVHTLRMLATQKTTVIEKELQQLQIVTTQTTTQEKVVPQTAIDILHHRTSTHRCGVLFSVWSLRVCLPLLNCSFTMYARPLLWPLAVTASVILLYRLASSATPTHEVINVALATLLAITASGLALFVRRRDLLAALSLTASVS